MPSKSKQPAELDPTTVQEHPGTGVENVGIEAPADGQVHELVVDGDVATALREVGQDPVAAADLVNYHRAYAEPHPIIESKEAEAE